MLATPHDRPTEDSLRHSGWMYEVKYDGMRALVSLEPAEPLARVVVRSRLGRDKTAQFPDVVRALRQFGRKLKRPVLLDGELVALDTHGGPLGFQQLAGRIHLTSDGEIAAEAGRLPVAFFAFDILRDGGDDLRDLPLVDRKARLEKVFGNAASELVRMTETAAGDGSRLYERVRKAGGEGLIGKEAHSCYDSGRRSPAWRKLKLLRRQEFVVCGWTMPRESRKHFGSLVLGYYSGPEGARHLKYAGTAGSGFTDAELDRVWRLLSARAQEECPFSSIPPTPERARWVRPELVAEVRFTEWTRDGVLRHPVYLGLRPDVDPSTISREEEVNAPAAPQPRMPSRDAETKPPGAGSSTVRASVATGSRPSVSATRRPSRNEAVRATTNALDDAGLAALVTQLERLEDSRRDGALHLPDGSRIDVGNLAKIFWPVRRLTKGALMRHYVRIAPWLLPGLADRPLVMKRFPNGVAGKSFYQQRAPDDVPAGVRVEQVQEDDEVRPRIVGGSLATLLYTTQLAAISQDPWFSRLAAPGLPDYVALDLDPMPGVPFAQVREVARAVRDELLALDVPALAKTSGSSGLHVYIALAAGTPYEAGQLFCQIIATMVAAKLPRVATVERAVARRGRTVYIDYLQNILGKTLATAYSARASEFAGVSTPLGWHELDEPFDPQDFTLETVIARFRETGDLWAPMHTGRRLDLREALERLAR
jgi:bifunctional non-homologous end joining protein LigD